ncbi:MAG TPA: hypothetical protein VKF41_05500 [Bryobacteraceae bacterium]|nr:hypothetical protein [Bryobacteraceae bacterium]
MALQSRCELRRVGLRQCHASLEGTEAALTSPFCLRVSHNSIADAPQEGTLRIEARFQAQGYDSSEPPALLFSIECAFDLDYEIQGKTFEPTPLSIAAFKDGNAIFNAWPYARELVNSLTSRMDLHAPPLPFLRIVPKLPEISVPEDVEQAGSAGQQQK